MHHVCLLPCLYFHPLFLKYNIFHVCIITSTYSTELCSESDADTFNFFFFPLLPLWLTTAGHPPPTLFSESSSVPPTSLMSMKVLYGLSSLLLSDCSILSILLLVNSSSLLFEFLPLSLCLQRCPSNIPNYPCTTSCPPLSVPIRMSVSRPPPALPPCLFVSATTYFQHSWSHYHLVKLPFQSCRYCSIRTHSSYSILSVLSTLSLHFSASSPITLNSCPMLMRENVVDLLSH